MDVYVVLRTPAYVDAKTYVVAVCADRPTAEELVSDLEMAPGDVLRIEVHMLKPYKEETSGLHRRLQGIYIPSAETIREDMNLFRLVRDEDESGVSGTGHVADGVEFHNGKCAVSWRTEHTTITIYEDIQTVEAIHGHGGKTRIEWLT
jgi:hypothetical protein